MRDEQVMDANGQIVAGKDQIAAPAQPAAANANDIDQMQARLNDLKNM